MFCGDCVHITAGADAIMVINLFRKDALTGSALIKGLAVRTMGCLRVQKLNEYLSEPLI